MRGTLFNALISIKLSYISQEIKYKCLNISISILNFISASGAQIGPIKEEDDEYDIELRKKKESSNDDRENISKPMCEFEKDKNQSS